MISSALHPVFTALLSATLLMSPPRVVSDPEAKRLVKEAQHAFGDGDYDEAAEKIEAAYSIEPAPALLYPWAQAERNRGQCGRAIELYEEFIATGPDEAIAEQARENIERCREQMVLEEEFSAEEHAQDDADEVETSESGANEEEEIVASVPQPNDRVRPWYRDAVGGALLGGGVAGVAIGLGLYGGAASIAKSVGDVTTDQDHADQRKRATGLRNGSIIAVSIGGALLVGAAVRYTLQARKRRATQVSAWVDPSGSFLIWSGRF